MTRNVVDRPAKTVATRAGSPCFGVIRRLLAALLLCGFASLGHTQTEEKIPAPTAAEAQERVVHLLTEAGKLAPKGVEALAERFSDSDLLDAVVESLAPAFPEAKKLLDAGRQLESAGVIDAPFWKNEQLDPYLRSNFALAVGREFVRAHAIDEGLTVLRHCRPEQACDPIAYYFHQAICYYQLQQPEEALTALIMLDRIADVPKRYADTAGLLRANLRGLKKEELGGIAHDMRDIRRRLSIGQPTEKTVEVEKDVIARLDALIKKLEDQQNQSSSGGAQGSQPMQDSKSGGVTGEGNVDPRSFKNLDPWGNLPPREREKVRTELDRDYPAHYREVIDQYFRRLANLENEK